METRLAYNQWAAQYDTNNNKTRDLEAAALRDTLGNISFDRCLEVGCGTGKNTGWLVKNAQHVTAVDFSEEMLAKAKDKINSDRVEFKKGNILSDWDFASQKYQLVSFSLVLEHIEQLEPVFQRASEVLQHGGYLYVGELHPFKQYAGSKARFDTEAGTHVVECFNHHISDFVQSAKKHGLQVVDLNEYFDDGDRLSTPRILTLLFQKI